VKDNAKNALIFWFSFIAIGVMTLSNIPYWTGKHSETNEAVFRGSYVDEADYAVHLSMMQAGRMGDWMYQMRFTDEVHRPAFIRLFYLILGHISKWINLDVETTFQAARWVFGLLALFSIYKLCTRVMPDPSSALFAFLISSVGSGLGWLQLMLGAPLQPISPIDFWLIDAYVFFSLSLFPSFSLTIALMATCLTLYFDFLESSPQANQKAHIALICLVALVVQAVNPIAFAVIDVVFLCATLLFWWKHKSFPGSQFIALSVIAACQIPLLVYNFLILTQDPIWRQFTLQNETLSPPMRFYFWGFLPFLLFAIWGMIESVRKKNLQLTGITAWALAGFAFAYLPVLIQRRFLLGITIPLGMLAIYGLHNLMQDISQKVPALKRWRNLIFLGYALFSSISSIYLVLGSSLFLQSHPAEKYYSKDLESALTWLDANAEPNDFVLGNIQTSQMTAQRTRLKVYMGHEMETLNYEEKITLVESYYSNPQMAEDWLGQTSTDWVIYGPYEKKLSDSFTPGGTLTLVYQNHGVEIYKVNR
jgi:hypothetical protein